MNERTNPQAAFSEIYETEHWKGGSGVGSRSDLNSGYQGLIERLIRATDVSCVVDAGCGDWQFSRSIDWSTVTYRGFDVVESVIETNKREFAASNVSFEQRDFSRELLPKADLLLCKDVLQHWPSARVNEFMRTNTRRYRYMLITNDVASVHCASERLNTDISFGQWRTLDLEQAPFGLHGRKHVEFDYMSEWTKRSVLFCSTSRAWIATRKPGSAINSF